MSPKESMNAWARRSESGEPLRRGAIAVACDQALDRRIARALASAGYVDPCDEATTPPTTAPRRLDELLVVDESSHLLGPDDLGELGPGEGGVEEVGVGAQLRQGDGRLDEAPVVATEDTDVVALSDTRLR